MSSDQTPIEIIQLPNTLKARVGPGVAVDVAAVKRAEAALDRLKAEYSDWISAETERVLASKNAFADSGSDTARRELLNACLELKGQALTFHHPMLVRVAGSLCRLLEQSANLGYIGLIGAHVDAMRVVARDRIRTVEDGLAAMLVNELEGRVDEALNA
jgi:hypothetical protein